MSETLDDNDDLVELCMVVRVRRDSGKSTGRPVSVDAIVKVVEGKFDDVLLEVWDGKQYVDFTIVDARNSTVPPTIYRAED